MDENKANYGIWLKEYTQLFTYTSCYYVTLTGSLFVFPLYTFLSIQSADVEADLRQAVVESEVGLNHVDEAEGEQEKEGGAAKAMDMGDTYNCLTRPLPEQSRVAAEKKAEDAVLENMYAELKQVPC